MATQRTRTQAAPIKLTELPAECLEVVFEQLDLKDRLCGVASTCRGLRDAVFNSKRLWRTGLGFSRHLHQERSVEAAQSFQRWLARRLAVQELGISLCSSWDRTGQDPNAARASRVWPFVFAALAGCSASLCRLTLVWNSTLPSDPWLLSLPNLCNLTLTGAVVTLPKELTALTCLTVLDIQDCTVVSAEGFPVGLVELFLKDTQLSGLPASLSALGRLTDLTFVGVDLSAADLNILSSLASLKTLALTDTCIASLPVSLTVLRSLNALFLENERVPLADIDALLSGLPPLKRLGLQGCDLDMLPPSLSGRAGNLTTLFFDRNDATSLLAGGSSAVCDSVKTLGLSLGCLPTLLNDLAKCTQLHALYIWRDDAAELDASQVDEVVSTLASHSALTFVGFVGEEDKPESFHVLRLLLRLAAAAPKLRVDVLEFDDVSWG